MNPLNQKILQKIWPKYCCLIVVLLISPMIFAVPDDVFTQYPWIQAYVNGLAQGIPMIDRAAHLHPHPEKFKVFFAYAWTLLPLQIWLIRFDPLDKGGATVSKLFEEKPATGLIGLVLLVWAAWVLFYVPVHPWGGSGLLVRYDIRFKLYTSDLALLWSGPFQIYFFSAAFWYVWHSLKAIRAQINKIKTPGQEL